METTQNAQTAVLVFTSETGVIRKDDVNHPEYVCPAMRAYGMHCIDTVMADLPGDRTVGYCECGEYIDTGTWDERNGG